MFAQKLNDLANPPRGRAVVLSRSEEQLVIEFQPRGIWAFAPHAIVALLIGIAVIPLWRAAAPLGKQWPLVAAVLLFPAGGAYLLLSCLNRAARKVVVSLNQKELVL